MKTITVVASLFCLAGCSSNPDVEDGGDTRVAASATSARVTSPTVAPPVVPPPAPLPPSQSPDTNVGSPSGERVDEPQRVPELQQAPEPQRAPEPQQVQEPQYVLEPQRAPEPQLDTVTITSSSLIDKVAADIYSATSEEDCEGIKGKLALLSVAVMQRRQRLADIGDNGRESLGLRYLGIVLDNLSDAAEYKRKALIQVDRSMRSSFESAIPTTIAGARMTSSLCPGSYTLSLSS